MHIAAGAMADLCGGVHAVYLVFIRQPNLFLYSSASRGGTLKYTCRLPDAHTESQSRPTLQRTGTSHRTPLSARQARAPHRHLRSRPPPTRSPIATPCIAQPHPSPTPYRPLYPPRRRLHLTYQPTRASPKSRKQVCRQHSLPGNMSAGRPRQGDMAEQPCRHCFCDCSCSLWFASSIP
jgi:hypothetical protein